MATRAFDYRSMMLPHQLIDAPSRSAYDDRLDFVCGSSELVSRLIKLVESFGRQRVLLVGDLILDRYVYGDAERISPEAPVPVLRQQHTDRCVGGCGSVAANLRSLGIHAICCGAVGQEME